MSLRSWWRLFAASPPRVWDRDYPFSPPAAAVAPAPAVDVEVGATAVSILDLKAEDVLVLQCGEVLPQQTMDQLSARMQRLGIKAKVIILDRGMSIAAVIRDVATRVAEERTPPPSPAGDVARQLDDLLQDGIARQLARQLDEQLLEPPTHHGLTVEQWQLLAVHMNLLSILDVEHDDTSTARHWESKVCKAAAAADRLEELRAEILKTKGITD